MHDAFVKLLETGVPTVSEVEKAESDLRLFRWLQLVQARLSVDRHRRDRHQQLGEDRCMEEVPDTRREAHDLAVLSEEISRLRHLIDGLSEPHREVMRLRSEGLKNPEISRLTGIDVAQVARLVSDSFAVIRKGFVDCGLMDPVRRGRGNHVDPR